ncbi:MAG: MurR/RpiR family transcriptional regulator [Planctomycetes bacterium]|nr:MurR/RpiR family transcriptional regulator [Planctomycetota bacterium]
MDRTATPQGGANPATGADLVFRLQTELDTLSAAERRIAEYFLSHPRKIAATTITTLAARLHLSTSTITRFCQKLGYAGFSQFKFNFENSGIAAMLAKGDLERDDSIQVIKEKLSALYQRSIEETLQRLTISELERAAELLAAADKVFFFGQFGNGVSATLGEALFLQLGVLAFAYTEHPLSSLAAAQLGPRDVAVGISSSGQARLPVDALRIARKQGATTIGITGFASSLLAGQSDLVLTFNLGVEDIRLVHIDRLCEAIILGVLQNCVIRKNYDLVKTSIRVSRATMLSGRYAKREKP